MTIHSALPFYLLSSRGLGGLARCSLFCFQVYLSCFSKSYGI